VADDLRKCSGHDEHHVTLYTYVTLYISKSRPAMAGVADRAPPPMVPAILSLMVRSAAFLMSALMYVGWDESTNMAPNAIGLSTSLFDNVIA
jgi:hypothetical protein